MPLTSALKLHTLTTYRHLGVLNLVLLTEIHLTEIPLTEMLIEFLLTVLLAVVLGVLVQSIASLLLNAHRIIVAIFLAVIDPVVVDVAVHVFLTTRLFLFSVRLLIHSHMQHWGGWLNPTLQTSYCGIL